jgi:aspartyl-tRNA synthetase
MYNKLDLRHKAVKLIRDFLCARDFLEVETPIMTKATPEGARDYVVPYRLQPGKFYALPQSPQQYKQLLMVGGVERYFQIARCFRDEAQRADRQPEFTQLDLEMSFIEQEDILVLMEELTTTLIRELCPKQMPTPWPRLSYRDSMARFGTDKPDLRFGLELCEIGDMFGNTEFNAFRSVLDSGGIIKAVRYPGGASLSRKDTDALAEFCKQFGAKGMAHFNYTAEGLAGGIAKFVPESVAAEVQRRMGCETSDMVCVIADTELVANEVLARLRNEIGVRTGLADPNVLSFCWVLDFPLVLWNEEEKRWDSSHHPFTMPFEEDLPLLETDPGNVRAQCYDVVCNGVEWASGSIRIHRTDIQSRVFDLLGVDKATQRSQFGHILDAFEYGAPPHGGIAPGIDRLIMFMLGEDNIREVMAFPKIGGGYDPMMDSPAEIPQQSWEELGLALRPVNEKNI